MAPYFIAGAGFFNLSTSDITLDVSQVGLFSLASTGSESAMSLTFGAGIDFKLSEKMSLFAEDRGGVGTTKSFKVVYTPMKLGLPFQAE